MKAPWEERQGKDITVTEAERLSPNFASNIFTLINSEQNILVTGATGLVGSYLLKQLIQKGKRVRALYRTAPSSLLSKEEVEKVEWIPGDILDVDALSDAAKNVDQLYHCAAMVTFNPARKNEMFAINIEGTANVVNASIEAGIKKMVHVSSVSAMGRIRKEKTIDETMYWTPETSNSSYGQSKYLSELEVWRGIGEGLKAVIINPTIILGAGDWSNGSSKIFKSAFEEFPWYTEGISGFVDVRDVAKAMILLMDSDIASERIILSAENRSYKDIFTLIAKGFGKKPPHRQVNSFISAMVWRMAWLKSRFTGEDPLLTKETAATARAIVYFENSKIKRLLPGFEYLSIEQSILDTCLELRERHRLD